MRNQFNDTPQFNDPRREAEGEETEECIYSEEDVRLEVCEWTEGESWKNKQSESCFHMNGLNIHLVSMPPVLLQHPGLH